MFTCLFNSNKFFQIPPPPFSTAREAEKEKIYHCIHYFASHCILVCRCTTDLYLVMLTTCASNCGGFIKITNGASNHRLKTVYLCDQSWIEWKRQSRCLGKGHVNLEAIPVPVMEFFCNCLIALLAYASEETMVKNFRRRSWSRRSLNGFLEAVLQWRSRQTWKFPKKKILRYLPRITKIQNSDRPFLRTWLPQYILHWREL